MHTLPLSCLVLLAVWSAAGPAVAAALVLTEGDREEAIGVGRRSIVEPDFGAEWRVQNRDGARVTVMTPFHRLALAARNAAFKSEALRPREIEQLVKTSSGKIEFWATLHGPTPDFARFYAPALAPAGRPEIRPAFVQNERTAAPAGGGRYAARCLYVFPAEGLSGTGHLILVVRGPTEAEVARFTVDLAAMR